MRLEVGDGAGAALLAIEAELVVVGRAALGVLEAVRQQQQPAVEGDGLDLFAPELVGDADHREAEILLAEARCRGAVPRPASAASALVSGLERSRFLREARGLGTDAVAQLARLGHDLEVGGVELRRFCRRTSWSATRSSAATSTGCFGSEGHVRGSSCPSQDGGRIAAGEFRRARPRAATVKIIGYSFSKYQSLAK